MVRDQSKRTPRTSTGVRSWSGWSDLNWRPPAPKAGAASLGTGFCPYTQVSQAATFTTVNPYALGGLPLSTYLPRKRLAVSASGVARHCFTPQALPKRPVSAPGSSDLREPQAIFSVRWLPPTGDSISPKKWECVSTGQIHSGSAADEAGLEP